MPGQVIWVWLELGFGFIYGIETLGRKLGKDWSVADPQDDWKIVHFLGYDNTFYHSIFSPALYKIASPGWTPDIDYNVNEFYLLDGDKFSTSRRHVIWGKDILTPDNVDAIRFYLSLTRPETRRTNFTLERLRGRGQATPWSAPGSAGWTTSAPGSNSATAESCRTPASGRQSTRRFLSSWKLGSGL